ncbi:sulfite reductase subunit beta [Epithele typhae]|uniref:sulfite reductase subunit beta n=1 Tax=Epithele typhae TaxID=378194 RepID=UPI00200796EF|nr:sulfite reductase subunit beta [Epithele typhae]KAH9940933.1 sulfite reductase subunit beta [Epithele typhae]
MSPAVASVARIAYHLSDALVLSLPPSGISPFQTALRACWSVLLRHRASRLVTYVASAYPQALHQLVLHLPELSSTPTVFHIAVDSDLSDAIVLQSSLPFVLHSRTAQQAHDHALLASKLASTESVAVLHIFHLGTDDESVDVLADDQIPAFLPDAATLLQQTPYCVVALGRANLDLDLDGVTFVNVALLKPLLPTTVLDAVPATVTRIIVLEQLHHWSMKWTPLYLEVVSALQQSERDPAPVRGDVHALLDAASSGTAQTRLALGPSPSATATTSAPHVPKHETAYTKMLRNVFADRLNILNSPELVAPQARLQPLLTRRAVRELLRDPDISFDLRSVLTRWLGAKDDGFSLRHLLPALSRWIIGSDAWAYDLGASGLHHAIASKLNVNEKDVGLYAMNHGDVYVASTAVYSSYSQVLQALMEADRFDGPSVVLAYLPYTTESTPALEILKETKLAVDSGYWPLYRWNPSKERENKEPFSLDSDSVKNELQAFLDRQNHLSQLVRSKPELAAELVGSLGESLKQARKQRAAQAYTDLLSTIDAPPLTVLYASDGGKAEKVAKRLATRGKLRGLSTTVASLDSISLEDIAKEEFVALVTSVAGQGEFPQNARAFMKLVNAASTRAERPLERVQFAVFGMGDSHYWPRPEDAHHYNKAGKDLDARLEQLGATRHEAEPEPITNEHIKVASQYLRGTIAEGLEDTSTGALAASDTQLTKFHGIYQQDDRDIRDERQAMGAEPAYSFMIRVRMPAGVCLPEQWLIMDQIADEHGNGTYKITTRQTFQFHGVIKRHLKSAIQDINRALLDTLAACGDVNRNVIVSTVPSLSKLHHQAYDFAKKASEHLLPRTSAYHEIWLDKKLVAGDALKDVEPLYGEFYLPRKFKIAVAIPPNNDVDVFANDVGFIAIVDKHGDLAGFNVTAGGGMGVTHGNKKTYPRAGSVLGFCTVEQGVDIAEKIMLVQRDNGNRADRKNARLKYTIDRMSLETFKAEVERRLGYKLEPARPFTFDKNVDEFGWATGQDGKHHFTCFIENGRVQDEPGKAFKTGLREIAKVHKGTFRMTANQHLVISDVPPAELPTIKRLLAEYKLDNLAFSGLRLSSSACVSFPTCGLAMAESERYLPILVEKVEKICEENGLRNDSIVMRMTGCPNGCARPYLAEVAFVGKAPGTYLMLLGGGYHGQRLNKIYRETVTEPEILAILGPMIKRYALERHDGEHFGDFVIRAGYIAPTTSGAEWYDRMGGEGKYREIAVTA